MMIKKEIDMLIFKTKWMFHSMLEPFVNPVLKLISSLLSVQVSILYKNHNKFPIAVDKLSLLILEILYTSQLSLLFIKDKL
jgi:hypothetical protein